MDYEYDHVVVPLQRGYTFTETARLNSAKGMATSCGAMLGARDLLMNSAEFTGQVALPSAFVKTTARQVAVAGKHKKRKNRKMRQIDHKKYIHLAGDSTFA